MTAIFGLRNPIAIHAPSNLTKNETLCRASVRNVIREHGAGRKVDRHRPHLERGKRARGPQSAVEAQPVAILEFKEDGRVATAGDDSAGLRSGRKAKLPEVFRALHEADAILAIENEAGLAVRSEGRWGRGQGLQSGAGRAATVAAAFGIDDGRSFHLEMDLPASAGDFGGFLHVSTQPPCRARSPSPRLAQVEALSRGGALPHPREGPPRGRVPAGACL